MSPAGVEWYAEPLVFGASLSAIWFVLWPIVSAALAAFATHLLTRRRDKENFHLRLEEEAKIASRQIRRERLLDAYRALDASEPQRTNFKSIAPDSEEMALLAKRRAAALSEVNLFGNEQLAGELDVMFEQGNAYDTSRIMNYLRDFLREEFGLEVTEARYRWAEVRIGVSNDNARSKGR